MDKEIGTTIRYPSSALLLVNSEDSEQFDKQGFRIDGGTSADLYINKQNPLLYGFLTRIALTEMNVQWGFQNVYADSQNSNNTLTIQLYNAAGVSQGITRVSVTPGFYAAGQLGKAVANALNANPLVISTFGPDAFVVLVGGLSCTLPIDPANMAGSTEKASSGIFTIVSAAINPSNPQGFFQIMPFNTPVATLKSVNDDLTNMMGLTPSATPGLPYYKVFEGGYASCMRTPYIDIVSKSLTINQRVKDNDTSRRGQSSVLARVYLSNEEAVSREITITYGTVSPFGSIDFTDNAFGTKETVFRREFRFPKMLQWNNTENVDAIDLQVLDYRGNILQYKPTKFSSGFKVTQSNTNDFQFTLMGMEQ